MEEEKEEEEEEKGQLFPSSSLPSFTMLSIRRSVHPPIYTLLFLFLSHPPTHPPTHPPRWRL